MFYSPFSLLATQNIKKTIDSQEPIIRDSLQNTAKSREIYTDSLQKMQTARTGKYSDSLEGGSQKIEPARGRLMF